MALSLALEYVFIFSYYTILDLSVRQVSSADGEYSGVPSTKSLGTFHRGCDHYAGSLSAVYAQYAPRGGVPYTPEILLGLLFYGYVTGVFSSRKIEQATYESIPFRFIAGGWHPDHDTIANFRKTFLPEITELFVQVLLVAKEAGVLKLGNISLDGSKIHADASKSKAVSYKRLLKLERRLRVEVDELLVLSEQVDQGQLPEGLDIREEIVFRQQRLANLAQAKAVLEMRAEERYQAQKAAYEAKLREREEKTRRTGRKPRGRKPKPPQPGPRDTDQYNFTDPESRIMKNSTNGGFDQHYNVQVAVEQESFLVVANTLSNHAATGWLDSEATTSSASSLTLTAPSKS